MHAGTFNANPVTMTAGLATMKQLTQPVFERLDRMGDELRSRIQKVIDRREFPAQVSGKGSLFWVHLTAKELTDYRSFVASQHDWPGSDLLRPPYARPGYSLHQPGLRMSFDSYGPGGDGPVH